MKARSKRTVESLDRVVRIRTEDFTHEESRWIREQGEPEIDLGGDFGSGPGAFSLPASRASVRSGMADPGVVRRFSPSQHDDPSAAAIEWEQEILSRIVQAMEDLKNNDVVGFTGETVQQPSYI